MSDRAEQTIVRLKRKLASAPDPPSALYFWLCLAGWRAWLAKVEQGVRPLPFVHAE